MRRILVLISATVCFSLQLSQAQTVLDTNYQISQIMQTTRPIGLAFDSNGDLIVANAQQPPRKLTRVQLSNGSYASDSVIITFNGNDHRPEFITTDPNDNIYFGRPDFDNGDLYRLTPSLNIDTIYHASNQELDDPRGHAFDANGDLFVAINVHPNGDGFISKFTMNSNYQVVSQIIHFIDSFPSNVMDLKFAPNGDLYVASDETVSQIKFDGQGNVQSVDYDFVDIPVTSSGGSFSAGLAIDDDGSMYVTHLYTSQSTAGKIYSFDTLGNISLFAQGFNQPRDIIFDDEHRMYVSDFMGGKIYVIEPIIGPIVVSLQGTDVDCHGSASGSIVASSAGGSGNHGYVWNTGDTTATISSLFAGTYTVTVTDGNGNTVVDSLMINEPDALTDSIDSQDEVCLNDGNGSASVTASGGTAPYTYLWSTGSSDSTISGLLPGTYTVTITDANGCTTTDQAVIGTEFNTLPQPDLGPDTLVTGQAAYVLDPGAFASYQWQDGSTGSTFSATASGTYWVVVTDDNGCSNTDSVTLTIWPLGVEHITESSFNVYPNPASQMLVVERTQGSLNQLYVRMFDETGREVSTLRSRRSTITSIDVSNLSNGIYFVEVVDGTRVENIKVIVQH